MRELARLALSPEWSIDTAMASHSPSDVAAAIDSYEAGLTPLGSFPLEAGEDGAFPEPMRGVRDWLKPMGMKIAPTMSREQCGAWLTAVALALSDFPPHVIIRAAKLAIRTPMSFLNEVDGHVRQEAERIMDGHRTALLRLRRMQEEIRRAANPQTALPAPEPEYRPTMDELRAMPLHLRRLGMAGGWITQQQLDEADAERSDQAA